MAGALHRPVVADEATWSIEEGQLVVTLVKAQRTGGNSHWRCVVEGEAEVDTLQFGPSVLMADITNPGDFAKHYEMLGAQLGKAG